MYWVLSWLRRRRFEDNHRSRAAEASRIRSTITAAVSACHQHIGGIGHLVDQGPKPDPRYKLTRQTEGELETSPGVSRIREVNPSRAGGTKNNRDRAIS